MEENESEIRRMSHEMSSKATEGESVESASPKGARAGAGSVAKLGRLCPETFTAGHAPGSSRRNSEFTQRRNIVIRRSMMTVGAASTAAFVFDCHSDQPGKARSRERKWHPY